MSNALVLELILAKLVEHAPQPGFDSRSGHTEDFNDGTCSLSSLVLGVGGWVQGNDSRSVLPQTRHQCSIHCENNRVNHGASKRRWERQTTRDNPKRSRSYSSATKLNWTILLKYWNYDCFFDEKIANVLLWTTKKCSTVVKFCDKVVHFLDQSISITVTCFHFRPTSDNLHRNMHGTLFWAIHTFALFFADYCYLFF